MNDLPSALCAQLSTLLGTRFSLTSAVRDQHAGSGMHLKALPPQAVAMVELSLSMPVPSTRFQSFPMALAPRSNVMSERPLAASRSISPV